MDQSELLVHLKGIHGVSIDDISGIDPMMVRSFIDHEDERVAANAVFLSRLFPSQIALSLFEAAVQSNREAVVVAAASFALHLTDADAESVLKTILTVSNNRSVLRAAFRSASTLHLEKLRIHMQAVLEKLPEGGFRDSAKIELDNM